MPRALDLFCCAGGATKGLQRAGFHVTGVDINPQPRYCGDAFIQGDALEVSLEGYDFIWASPPCQAFTALRFMPTAKEHPNLIPQTRAKLIASGLPYCIENVEGAPLGDSGNLIVLCGTMFGLQTADGRAELRRHRLFETSFSIPLRPACQHGGTLGSLSICGHSKEISARCQINGQRKKVLSVVGHRPVDNTKRGSICVAGSGLPLSGHMPKRHAISVTGTGMGDRVSAKRRSISVTGSTPQTNIEHNSVRETFTVQQAREAMGIDWMTMKGLSQAIPPAYAEFIGHEALAYIASVQSLGSSLAPYAAAQGVEA